jgi:hypothetical protein
MRSSNLWQGVVGFWSASAGPSGYRLLDRSGRGNHGTLTNMTADDWVGDSNKWALDFDGVNDRVSIGSVNAPTVITCSGWVRRNGTPGGLNSSIITQGTLQGDASSTFALYWNLTLSSWTFFALSATNTLAIVRSNTASSTGIWYHVAGVCSEREIVLYIDGKRVNSSTGVAVKSSTQSANLGYGFSTSDQFHNGMLDDVFVRNQITSDAEMAQLYQIGRGGMLTPRRRRRAYSVATGLRRRLLLTGQV